MSSFKQYWTLATLTATGQHRAVVQPAPQNLLQQLYPSADAEGEVESDRLLQRQLLAQASGDFNAPAMLALRCYISHQILAICRDFTQKFGQNHCFKTSDCLGYVLDDSGTLVSGDTTYQIRSAQILRKFDPDKASLSTWTKQIIQADKDLNEFFHQQGLRLISDWALLNSATPGKLKRLLPGAVHLPQTLALLNAYHRVYRQARLMRGDRGRCQEPSLQQCQAISDQLAAQAFLLSADEVLEALQALARLIRADDIASKRGAPAAASLDDPAQPVLSVAVAEEPDVEAEIPWAQLSDRYQAEFSACLHRAAKDVITARHQRLKPKKAELYPRAMVLFYCEGWKMTAIASQLGISDQSGVSRLLDLKRLRADLRHEAIAELTLKLSEICSPHMSPSQLAALDQRIDETLGPEIDLLIKAEWDEAQTPSRYLTRRSPLAQIVSQVLRDLYRTAA